MTDKNAIFSPSLFGLPGPHIDQVLELKLIKDSLSARKAYVRRTHDARQSNTLGTLIREEEGA